jgi:hypothetical protein
MLTFFQGNAKVCSGCSTYLLSVVSIQNEKSQHAQYHRIYVLLLEHGEGV